MAEPLRTERDLTVRDPLQFIMDVESGAGQMDATEYAEGMVGLIRSGIINGLQGSWQRAAMHLVESGIITKDADTWIVDHDALDRALGDG